MQEETTIASFTLGRLFIRLDRREILNGSSSTPLTELEERVLTHLWHRRGEVVTHRELLSEVWGYAATVESRAPHHTITRLRQKLLADPAAAESITTVRGRGYRLEAPSPAPATSTAPPLSPLVGREDMLAALRARLVPGALVTITGPGGIGKTRLARHHLQQEPRGGLWISLEAAHSHVQAHRAIEDALDGSKGAGVGVACWLREQGDLLVVIDGAEQVTEAIAAEIAVWRQQAPRLRLLVTSHCPLQLEAEQRLPLGALAAPEALVLFLAQVRRRQPDLTVSTSLEPLLRRLGGLPLAIELAAGHAGFLSEPDSLPLALCSQDRDIEPRHASLRGMLEQSWRALDAPLQVALAHLSIFEDSFTLPAACAVLPAVPEPAVLVEALAARSLVQVHGERLGLMAHIRAFGATKLSAAETHDAQQRHTRFYAALGERHRLEAARSDPAAQQMLLAELANLNTVTDRALAAGAWSAGALAWLAAHGLLRQGRLQLDAERLRPLLAAPDLPLLLRARLLSTRADYHRLSGRSRLALEDNQAALASYRACGLEHEAAIEQCSLGACLYGLDELEAAQAAFEEARAAFCRLGDTQREGRAWNNLATIHTDQGRLDAAEQCCRTALQRFITSGDQQMESAALRNLGSLYASQGNRELAWIYLHRALDIARPLRDERAVLRLLCDLGNLHNNHAEPTAALARYHEALALVEALDDRHTRIILLGNIGLLWQREGDLAEALRHYEQALSLAETLDDQLSQAIARSRLGAVLCARGASAYAETLLQAADDFFATSHDIVQRGAHACRRAEAAATPAQRSAHLDAARTAARQAALPEDSPLWREIHRLSGSDLRRVPAPASEPPVGYSPMEISSTREPSGLVSVRRSTMPSSDQAASASWPSSPASGSS